MTPIVTSVMWLLAGICVHAGINHILVGMRAPRVFTHVLFGVQCLFAAAGTLVIARTYVITDVAVYLQLYRAANILVMAFFVCMPWVVAGYTGARPRWPATLLSAGYLAVLLIELTLPFGILFQEYPVLRTLQLPWGDTVSGHANVPTVFLDFFWIMHLLLFVYVGWACTQQYRRGQRRPAITLLIGLLPFATAVAVNILVSLGLLRFVFIGAFGFIAMVLLMSWGLSRELQRSQHHSQAVLDNVPAVIWIKDLAGRYTFINNYCERMFGRSMDDVVGKTDHDLFTPEIADARRSSDQWVLHSNRREHVEERLALNHEQRTLLALKFPLRESDGSQYALCGISTDITDSKRTADAMRALAQSSNAEDSDKFFRDCVEKLASTYRADFAFIVLCAEGDEVLHAQSVWPQGSAVDAVGIARALCNRVLQHGRLHVERDVRQQFHGVPALESLQAEGLFVAPLISSTQRTTGIVGVVTRAPLELFSGAVELLEVFAGRIAVELDRIAAVDALRALAAQLESRVSERTRELEAFSYSVSHDLRTPLRAIDGFTALVLESLSDSADLTSREHLKRVRDTARRMEALIDDLLQLAKVARHEIRREHIDLSVLIQQAATRLTEQEPQRKVRIAIVPGMKLFGDPNLIAVVVDNLLGNAWKYTSRTEHASIEAGVQDIGDTQAFFVKDNGVGFDPAYADRLFQAFQRLHDSKAFAGTGVGLAIVARIIERHNGKVWGESTPGSGATFYFSLPRQ